MHARSYYNSSSLAPELRTKLGNAMVMSLYVYKMTMSPRAVLEKLRRER